MQLGIIEGFYGRPWTWKARFEYADFIKRINFDFYIYAPKKDKYLRENWKEPFPRNEYDKLKELSIIYHQKGIKWGVGLSLFKAYLCFDNSVKSGIKKKLAEIASLNPDIIAILFDDMEGNIENIAKTQVEIVHFILEHTDISKILFCPTYYSFDPILDNFFGQRPVYYLKYIGDNLDPKVDIIWTGPEVRSESIITGHLKDVQRILKRKPFIWDNYIANDGKEHSQFLYIKPFKNRNYDILKHISGYMVNPMNQANLSQIPLLTIADELGSEQQFPKDKRCRTQYDPEYSWKKAIQEVCGNRYSDKMFEYSIDLLKGLNALSEDRKAEMYKYFSLIKEDWAIELIEWLKEVR